MSIRRGDLIWASVFRAAGHDLEGKHPAVVVSPTDYNDKTGMCVICSITSVSRGTLFEIPLPEGLKIQGVVRIDQLNTIDWRIRKVEVVGAVPNATLKEVIEKLRIFLT